MRYFCPRTQSERLVNAADDLQRAARLLATVDLAPNWQVAVNRDHIARRLIARATDTAAAIAT